MLLFSIYGSNHKLIEVMLPKNNFYIYDFDQMKILYKYVRIRKKIDKNFCKKYLPGFEKAHISSIADSLGVRSSNRVRGKYVYTYEDLISGKKFSTPVLISNYPIDLHSDKKDCSTLQKIDIEYQLPLESLIVDDFENLFVIGRCISADFKAQGALRIIPSCFSMGEGLAKHISKTKTRC